MNLNLESETECEIVSLTARPLRDVDEPQWEVRAKLEIELGSASAAAGVLDLAGGAVAELAERRGQLLEGQMITLGVKFGAAQLVWEFDGDDPLSFRGGVAGRASLLLEPGEPPVLRANARGRLDAGKLARLQQLSLETRVLVRTRPLQQELFGASPVDEFRHTMEREGLSVSLQSGDGEPVELT